jgi:hypothetical protein
MAYAEWYVTTVSSQTKFGVAGYWVELPDAFPPIIYIKSDTTPGASDNDGCYFEYCQYTTMGPYWYKDWTTTTGGTTWCSTYKVGCGCCYLTPQKVDAFITHDKWFRIDGDGVSDGGETRTKKLLKLYYRDITEIGTIP